jgi:hypothetical protein
MSMRLSHPLLYATLFALVLGGGVAHGLLTDRWAAPDGADASWLDRVPLTVGDWDGTPVEMDHDQLPQAGSGDILLRRYVHRASGAAVMLFLTAGRAGPIVSAHQPDSCYPGAGFSFAAPVTKRAVRAGTRSDEFRVATFSKTERASPLYVRVYWAFSGSGDWRAPDSPRLAYAGQRRLYKMYVIRQLAKASEPLDDDPAVPFIQAIAPELEKSLFPGA